MGLFITMNQRTSENKANWCINRYLQTTSLSVSMLKKKMEKIGRFPYIPLAMFSSYFVSVSWYKNTRGSQLAMYLTNAVFGRLQAFYMYGGLGMSAPSLHRESTDSLIQKVVHTYYTATTPGCVSCECL